MAVKTAWIDTATGKTGFTALSSDVLPLAAPGSLAWITDQPGTIKQCDGITWITAQSGGAALVSDAALDYIPYSDATYDYYCEAAPGTALATAAWRIARKHNATGRIEYADGGAFSNAATDLATVQGAFA